MPHGKVLRILEMVSTVCAGGATVYDTRIPEKVVRKKYAVE
jgi:hypothetical protein